MHTVESPLVAILMGSTSDWETMESASKALAEFDVAHECNAISAHRAPEALVEYVKSAEARGVEVFIAGAGMAAALPGVVAAHTSRPVLGVPVESGALSGVDALHAIVQMPPGIPVGTLAIGKAGARNAALLAVSILAGARPELRKQLEDFRAAQTKKALSAKLPCEE